MAPVIDEMEEGRREVRSGSFPGLWPGSLARGWYTLQGKQMEWIAHIWCLCWHSIRALFSVLSFSKPSLLCSQVIWFRRVLLTTPPPRPPTPDIDHPPIPKGSKTRPSQLTYSKPLAVKNWFRHGHRIKVGSFKLILSYSLFLQGLGLKLLMAILPPRRREDIRRGSFLTFPNTSAWTGPFLPEQVQTGFLWLTAKNTDKYKR